jgi:NTE family protein
MATAIVTAGAGARGAYEAGVLSRVLPKLIDEEREDQIVLVGTSAGAINTAIMAGAAGLSATVVAERLCKTWCDLRVGKIFKPNPWAAVAYGAQALGFRRCTAMRFSTRPRSATPSRTAAT